MQYITGRIADSVAAISSFAKNRTSTPGQDELLARQRISDVRLSIEYKYLVDHAPGGVFMLPALGDNRTLYGVIFVRRGL